MSFIAISLEFSLTYVLFRSMLFNLQVFGDFPAVFLSLIFSVSLLNFIGVFHGPKCDLCWCM